MAHLKNVLPIIPSLLFLRVPIFPFTSPHHSLHTYFSTLTSIQRDGSSTMYDVCQSAVFKSCGTLNGRITRRDFIQQQSPVWPVKSRQMSIKAAPKWIALVKWRILTLLQKCLKCVGDLCKIIVAPGLEKLHKVLKSPNLVTLQQTDKNIFWWKNEFSHFLYILIIIVCCVPGCSIPT